MPPRSPYPLFEVESVVSPFDLVVNLLQQSETSHPPALDWDGQRVVDMSSSECSQSYTEIKGEIETFMVTINLPFFTSTQRNI